ncbi:hypothetical protein [Neolewinella agarilytica]|uniref:DUF2846 domain-containing protein n=1 Tax=Neolewinella agarilytica TaxID=478744 RepID=A0A1H9D5I0_9BACT|nr:hypothetical protein [Neolewinella agarilytica]SEQ08726.1 hypothetical protein SAMN05444359_105155 [Neolewinella agarilytica]
MLRLLLLFSIGLLFNACATTQFVNLAEKPPKEGTATIYVLRPTIFAYAVKAGIYQDDKPIGKLGPRSYLSWEVPGTGDAIEIMSKTENRKRVTITPLAGETYYLEQSFGLGFGIARSQLTPINATEGEEILARLKEPKVAVVE